MTKQDIDKIFESFGGILSMSKTIKVPYTTLHTWKRRGRIPEWRLEHIRKTASEHNIDLPRSIESA